MLNPPKMSPEIAALIDRMMKGEDPETLRPLMMKFMPKPGDPPRINAYTMGPMSCNRPAGLYDNMLTKVAPYPIRGVIWYQGEDDDSRGWSGFYDVSIKALITSWRKLWGIDFPFLQVELAPYEAGGEQDYPLLRRMQRKAADEFDGLHNVCIMDVGERHNIHPRRKKQVGERLALLARKYVYGDDILADSPRLAEARREGERIILRFENAGNGLHVEGDTINSLFVTAENETLSPKVTVAGNSIILEDAAIAGDTPVTVRFAEENYCEDNLYGSTGLPAFPFTAVL